MKSVRRLRLTEEQGEISILPTTYLERGSETIRAPFFLPWYGSVHKFVLAPNSHEATPLFEVTGCKGERLRGDATGCFLRRVHPLGDNVPMTDDRRKEGAMSIKDTIAAIRKEAGITQEEMARRLYVTRQAVSKWGTEGV